MNRKIFIIALVLILCQGVGTVFAGGGAADSGRTGAQGPVNVTYPITQPGARRLSYWIPLGAVSARHMSSFSEHIIFQAISRDTGIDIDWVHPAIGQEAAQLGILIASGDLPDIMAIRGIYPGGSSVGVAEGIFRDLTDLIPIHAPDYYNEIRKDDFGYRIATDNDGRITEFMIIKQRAPIFNRNNYRQDMMDQLGIGVPITLADYEDHFQRMLNANLMPFALPMSGKQELFMWPYGIGIGFYLGTDGTVKFGEMEPGYREYLTKMNEWWNRGFISPDFMTNVNDVDRRVWYATGIVQMMTTPVDLAFSATLAVGRTAVPLPYPRLYTGQNINFSPVSWETMPLRIENFATVVTSACRSPEVAVQYLNYTYTQAGADLMNWGIRDLTYTVAADGTKHFTDYMLRNPRVPLGDVQEVLKVHQHAKLAEPDVICNPNVVITPEALEIRMRYAHDPTVNDSQVLPSFQLSLRDSERRNEIMRDINTYVNEMTLRFITGVTPLSDFDSYVAQIRRMGIDEALQITEDGYRRFWAKPGLR